ncbi:hypothetical protein [Dactylosporangium salmoneum]|uniref:Uncharacterized protein n=1 Tax=Dactylosporangium salmoneum TaxID=53361 RepID=A0ABP5SRZ3_9ACTN
MTEPARRHFGGRDSRTAIAAGGAVLIVLLLALLGYCQYHGSGSGDDAAPGPSSTALPARTGGDASVAPSTGRTGAAGALAPTRTTAAPSEPTGDAGVGAAPTTATAAAPSGAPHTGGGDGLGMRSPVLAGTGIVLLLGAAALYVFRLRPRER